MSVSYIYYLNNVFVSTINPLLFLVLQANRTCPICRADSSEVHRDSEWPI